MVQDMLPLPKPHPNPHLALLTGTKHVISSAPPSTHLSDIGWGCVEHNAHAGQAPLSTPIPSTPYTPISTADDRRAHKRHSRDISMAFVLCILPRHWSFKHYLRISPSMEEPPSKTFFAASCGRGSYHHRMGLLYFFRLLHTVMGVD